METHRERFAIWLPKALGAMRTHTNGAVSHSQALVRASVSVAEATDVRTW